MPCPCACRAHAVQVVLVAVRGGAGACTERLDTLRLEGMALLAAARAPPRALPSGLSSRLVGWAEAGQAGEGSEGHSAPHGAAQPVLLLLLGREGAEERAAHAAHAAPRATCHVFSVCREGLEMLLAPPALGAGHVTQARHATPHHT